MQFNPANERKNLYLIYVYYEILQFFICVGCGSFSEQRRNNFLWLNPDFLTASELKFLLSAFNCRLYTDDSYI